MLKQNRNKSTNRWQVVGNFDLSADFMGKSWAQYYNTRDQTSLRSLIKGYQTTYCKVIKLKNPERSSTQTTILHLQFTLMAWETRKSYYFLRVISSKIN